MTLSLTLACVWAVVATGIAVVPGKYHWPAAYVMIALGIPLLGYVTYQNGPIWGLIVMAGGVSMLRWPFIYFCRWCVRVIRVKRP